MTDITTKPRWKVFLEALPKHDYKVRPSAIEAGYSQSYADHQPNLILTSALRSQAKEMLKYNSTSKPITREEAKPRLAEFLGISREEVGKHLKKIAINDKDYSSALKVLSVVSKEMGHNITLEEHSTVVPMLNIVLEKGSTEPQNLLEAEVITE